MVASYRDWEIYCTGDPADDDVFGYQERWAEYRYHPALITGRFRSTAASTLDSWHLAQKFSYRPVLNAAFINEDPPIARVSAVNTALTNQFIFDSFFKINLPLGTQAPVKIVPGTAGGRMVNAAGSPIPAGSLSTIAGGFFAELYCFRSNGYADFSHYG